VADKNPSIKLTEAQRRALIGIVSGDGYQVVLDVMEEFCNRAENDLIGLRPELKDEVVAQHAIVHAQRVFFQDVTRFIDTIIKEETGLTKDNSRFRAEALAQLVSALPMTEDVDSVI
jgi:hypothetical protein